MDGKVKSRGRQSLVKRHRGSRLFVPVPAARRQRDLGGHLRRSAAVGRATCPTTARLPAASHTSSRGDISCTVRVEAGAVAEHGAGDVEQAVGH